MSTTALVAELLVIGVGPVTATGILVITVFGYSWVPRDAGPTVILGFIVLAAAYILGILTDRIADKVMKRAALSLRKEQFPKDGSFQEARTRVYAHSPFKDRFEYGRSRLRICRGWVVNSVLLLVASNILIWARLPHDLPRWRLSLFVSLLFALLAVGFAFGWRSIFVAETEQVKSQDGLIRDGVDQN